MQYSTANYQRRKFCVVQWKFNHELELRKIQVTYSEDHTPKAAWSIHGALASLIGRATVLHTFCTEPA